SIALPPPPPFTSPLFPYTTLFRSHITEYGITDFVVGHYGRFDSLAALVLGRAKERHPEIRLTLLLPYHPAEHPFPKPESFDDTLDRKSTRLNSSHVSISYAVFCLK